MSRREASNILIEPSRKVVETLRLAMLDAGVDEFIHRTGCGLDLLEKWVNGRQWIPLGVIKEACNMNQSRDDAPPYSKVLSECTEDAEFRFPSGGDVHHTSARDPGETEYPEAKLSVERLKSGAIGARQDVSNQIIKIAVAVVVIPLVGAVAGFAAGGPWGAAVGTVLSFAIMTALLRLFIFRLWKPHGI